MSEWRPIEEAPKDGTPILGRHKWYAFPFVVFWSSRYEEFGDMPALPEGTIMEKSWLLSCSEDGQLLFDPEEWMPLPEPPK